MKTVPNLRLFAVLYILVVGFTGCSDDDENENPLGTIQVAAEQIISENTLIIPVVSVGQDSWLTAVQVGDENTNDFIAQPVLVKKGTTADVKLIIDESIFPLPVEGHQIVLKLYADNLNGGTPGQWDPSDEPIKNNNVMVTKTITVFAAGPDAYTFAWYDTNDDGVLDKEEALESYNFGNYFHNYWDTNQDDFLNKDEFYHTFFTNADNEYSNSLSQEEWNTNYPKLLNHWTDTNFSSADINKDNVLSKEEWLTIFEESGWFESYDSNDNSLVSLEEWHNGLFKEWDINLTNFIEQEEFEGYFPVVVSWWRW